MSERKKYKMRPARKNEKGQLQQVPIGYYKGKLSALASEGEYEVTPSIHRAFMCGDIDIDGYPHKRKGGVAPDTSSAPKPKTKPKTRRKKKEEAPAPAPTTTTAKTEDSE